MNDHSQVTKDRVARLLYRMNGQAWYGRSLGDWDDPTSRIGRNEHERDRWLRQADVVIEAMSEVSDA